MKRIPLFTVAVAAIALTACATPPPEQPATEPAPARRVAGPAPTERSATVEAPSGVSLAAPMTWSGYGHPDDIRARKARRDAGKQLAE